MTPAERLQREIDNCDAISCALARAKGIGNWRLTSINGRIAGLRFALDTVYPGLAGGRVYPLDKAAHEAEIEALTKQYQQEEHEEWLKEERGK